MLNITTINPDAPSDAKESGICDEMAASLETAKLTFFWISVTLCFLMGMLSSFGNGLVLYVSNKKDDFGGYSQVNWVVKNLALSDMLFGLIGCPLTIVLWTWSKSYKTIILYILRYSVLRILLSLFNDYVFKTNFHRSISNSISKSCGNNC